LLGEDESEDQGSPEKTTGPAIKRDPSLTDLGFCGCCTDTNNLCGNCEGVLPVYQKTNSFLEELIELPESSSTSLVVASWNVQSFGHNRLVDEPYQNATLSRKSGPYLAAVDKIASFVRIKHIDLLFIQETIDARALDDVVAALNSTSAAYTYSWVPTFVTVGLGFNRSKPKAPKPDELSAVIHKKHSDDLAWSLLSPTFLQTCEFKLEGLHESFTDLRDRFKRHPAYLCLSYGEETYCFCSLHLASDSESGSQRLRLNAEILSLPLLVAQLRAQTGADHVVLLGDFNRNPDTVCYSALYEAGYLPALLNGASNMGKVEHLYDNFMLPREVRSRGGVAARIGEDEWMRLPGAKVTSDHRPVLLQL